MNFATPKHNAHCSADMIASCLSKAEGKASLSPFTGGYIG